jgi:iron only hydrogenase large subunit-like protein
VFLLNPHLQTTGNFGLQSAGCTSCGKCISSCAYKALSLTNNIPLYKEAMSAKDTAKIAVLDSSIFYNLETKLGLKPGSLNLDAVCTLLKNMGFDYFLDQSLITDFEIIADAARIYKHGKKGFSQTIGSFCPSLTRKLLKIEPAGAEQVVESFLGPVEQFTTFVVTDCLSRRANETLYINNPRSYTSVGITTDEFVKIIKEGGYDFNGTPCKMMPLGSTEGVASVTSERFANSVVGTLGHSFLGAHLPQIQFKDIDKHVSLATFNIAENYTVRVASVMGAKGLDKLYGMNLEDVIYISPKECGKCYTPPAAIPSIDAESVKRQVKLAMDNKSAQDIWKYFMKQEDDETFINRPTGYYD